eukprot:437471-Rhodomonas_salina.1
MMRASGENGQSKDSLTMRSWAGPSHTATSSNTGCAMFLSSGDERNHHHAIRVMMLFRTAGSVAESRGRTCNDAP